MAVAGVTAMLLSPGGQSPVNVGPPPVALPAPPSAENVSPVPPAPTVLGSEEPRVAHPPRRTARPVAAASAREKTWPESCGASESFTEQ